MKKLFQKTSYLEITLLAVLSVFAVIFYDVWEFDRILIILETLCVLLIMVRYRREIYERNIFPVVLCGLSLLSMALTVFLHGGIGMALVVINNLFICLSFNNIRIPKKNYSLIHLITALGLTAYILASRIDLSGYVKIFTPFQDRINENMFSIIVLACVFHYIAFISCQDITFGLKWVFYTVVFSAGLIYILITKCRTTLIAYGVFLLLFIFKEKPFSNFTFSAIVKTVLSLSLLFTVAYVFLHQIFGQITILGKGLFTGREIIWESAFGQIKDYFVFGSGTEFQVETVNSGTTYSIHNTLLGIWKSFGLIPTVSFILIFINDMRNVDGKRYQTAEFALLSCLIICFFESFFTESTLYLLFLTFLLSTCPISEGEKND